MPKSPYGPALDAPMFDAKVSAIVLTLFVIASIAFHGIRHDDAYITFRYAENLARGIGPVFNPGERVLGTTAPAHMLLGAALYSALGKETLPDAMAVLGCLGWTAQALGVFAILRVGFSPAVAGVAALAVALGAVGSAGVVALETNLVAACVCWSLALLLRGRITGAAATAACAGLVRPDAYLLALLAGVALVWQQRRIPVRPLIVFATITLPWQLFALGYYGSVLPQSARRKYQNIAFWEYLVHECKSSVANLVPFGSGNWKILLAWVVVIAGAVVLVRRHRGYWLLVAYGGSHFLAYAWLRPFKDHFWHLYPLRLTATVLAAGALGWLYEKVGHSAARFLVAAGVLVLLAGYTYGSVDLARKHPTAYWLGARDAAYAKTAAYLRKHAKSDDVVAAVEVGTIGYYSGLVMHDVGGLITPNPDLPSLKSRVVWLAFDDMYLSYVRDTLPVHVQEEHGFRVWLFNIEWMGKALGSVMKRFPGTTPGQVLIRHRTELEQELLMLSAEAER